MWDIIVPPTMTLTMVVVIATTIMTAMIVAVTAIGTSFPLVVDCMCQRVLWYGELHVVNVERVSCVAVQVGSDIERILQMYNLMSEHFFTHASLMLAPQTCKCHIQVFILPTSPTSKLPPVIQGWKGCD
jgi:hypothetical protein